MKKFLALSFALMFIAATAFGSVSNQTNKVFGSGDGHTTTPFSFPFKVFTSAEIEVYEISPAGVVTGPLTLTSDYSVHISTSTEGGYITFATAPLAGYTTLIERVEPYTQSLVLTSEGPLPAKQIENQLDLQTMDIIQLKDAVDRALIQDTTSLLGTLTLPTPVAGYCLGWDSTGTSIINISAVGVAGPPGPAGSGAGDVLGPATNTDLYIPQWAGANTKTLANGVMLDTDGTLTANSDTRVPTQQAVKSYAAKKGANSDITSLAGLTTALTVGQGGTGATAAANGASGVVVLDSGTKLPAVDGSLLINLPSSGITATTETIFSVFGGDGSDGTPDLSSGANFSAIDSAFAGMAQFNTLTVPIGQTLTINTKYAIIAVKGNCIIHGTITADGAMLNTTGSGAGKNGRGYASIAAISNSLAGSGGGGQGSPGGSGGGAGSAGGAAGSGGAGGPGVVAPAAYTTFMDDYLTYGDSALIDGLGANSTYVIKGALSAALFAGGGGGGGWGSSGVGGNGGGVIYIEVGGTLTFDGTITANGTSGGATYGSGGGGGVIIIRTKTIGTNSGTVTVTGGVGAHQNGGAGYSKIVTAF